MVPPLGMSRLIRPVVLAALLITSIHLWREDSRQELYNMISYGGGQCSGNRGINYKQVSLLVPFKGVLALCSEKVNMGLELQFEDVLLVNAVWLLGGADCVAEQREASQGEVILQTTTDPLPSLACFYWFCSRAEIIDNRMRWLTWWVL